VVDCTVNMGALCEAAPASAMKKCEGQTLDEAPIDDEPLTAADKRAVTRARRGAYVSNEELRRKLGL
jgi:hypothetical protein